MWVQQGLGREDGHPIDWVQLRWHPHAWRRRQTEKGTWFSAEWEQKEKAVWAFPCFFCGCWWEDECSAHSEPGRTGLWEWRDYSQAKTVALKTLNRRHEKKRQVVGGVRVRGVHSHEVAPHSITAKHQTAPLALLVILEQDCCETFCFGFKASLMFSSVHFIS